MLHLLFCALLSTSFVVFTCEMDPYSRCEIGRSFQFPINLALQSVYLRGSPCRDVDATLIRMKCFYDQLKLNPLGLRSEEDQGSKQFKMQETYSFRRRAPMSVTLSYYQMIRLYKLYFSVVLSLGGAYFNYCIYCLAV